LYKIIIARKAKKSLPKLPVLYQKKIRTIIASLKFNPHLGKKLEGRYKNDYSIRVWPYRIIYTILKKQLVIEIIEIEHRGGAYRR